MFAAWVKILAIDGLGTVICGDYSSDSGANIQGFRDFLEPVLHAVYSTPHVMVCVGHEVLPGFS